MRLAIIAKSAQLSKQQEKDHIEDEKLNIAKKTNECKGDAARTLVQSASVCV